MPLVTFQRRTPRTLFPAYTPSPTFPTFDAAENRMNRFIERMFNEPFAAALPEPIGWMPAMDIVETAKEFTVTAELPGLDEKNIDVAIDDGLMIIRGEKTEERKDEEDKKVYLYERSYGSFVRSFALPAAVDASKIDAEFGKGVLKVHIPKTGDITPKGRKVTVKTV
jgi:HSP20 family protein